MNLFVIYIGGCHEKSLIELHDIRFIAANAIEETYETLRKSWWGLPKSLHIDAWGILEHADGHGIEISPMQPEENRKKLFFVNLGGYDKTQFTELHKNIFVVAANALEAKQKALMQIADWVTPHRDYMYEIDKLLNLNLLLENAGYYCHLDINAKPKPFEFTCRYNPIGSR